jgi:hypothetical protein
MNSKFSSYRQRVVNSLHERLGTSGESIPSRHLPHWAYVIFATSTIVVLLIIMLKAGYAELPDPTPLPSPSLPTATHYPSPTQLSTWDEPTAFVSIIQLGIFDSFGASGNYVAQLQAGDRVQVLAQSADGIWTQIRTWYGDIGWARTDYLVWANASHAPIPTVRAPMDPDVLFQDDFQNPDSGLYSEASETGETFYHNGEYVVRMSKYGWSWWPSYPPSFMDFALKVDARPVIGENLAYGLIFRSRVDSKYAFGIWPNGSYSLWQVTDGQWRLLADGEVDGPHISLYVNGQLLETVTDTKFQGGQVGVLVRHRDYQDKNKIVEARFDNIEVRSLAQSVAPTSTPTTTLSLSSTSVVENRCQFMHVVEIPDTIKSIAAMYGVSQEELAVANNAQSWLDLVGAGNLLCIPSSVPFTADSTIDPTPVPTSDCRFMHIVRPYDHPYYVSMRYGISEEALESANAVESGPYFKIGRALCIP